MIIDKPMTLFEPTAEDMYQYAISRPLPQKIDQAFESMKSERYHYHLTVIMWRFLAGKIPLLCWIYSASQALSSRRIIITQQ